MTQLLVSVRNADEAAIALAAGVSLIDVKEPTRGALGAADATTVRAVVDRIAGAAPVSVALGELASHDPQLGPQEIPRQGVAFAKIGLAGCALNSNWHGQWAAVVRNLPLATLPVAVTYADWQSANAPSPQEVLSCALTIGCGAVLIDTFEKPTHEGQRAALTDLWELDELGRYLDSIRQFGLLCVVAGSLCPRTIAQVLPLQPDYVAVRGAACRGKRTGTVNSQAIRMLVDLVASKKTL